jgi:parvulin-like peptidyl-prolyl isomerase
MVDNIDKTDELNEIERINNNILNEDVNEEYNVLEKENTFKRTEKVPSKKSKTNIVDEQENSEDNSDSLQLDTKEKNKDDNTNDKEENKKPTSNRKDDNVRIVKNNSIKNNVKKKVKSNGKKIVLKVQESGSFDKNSENQKKSGNKNNGNGKNSSEKNGHSQSNNMKQKNNTNGKKNNTKKFLMKGNNLRVEKMKHKTQKKNNTWMWIIFGVILVVVILALVFALKLFSGQPPQETNTQIAATVNGEPIYMSEIELKFNSLNPALQGLYTKEVLLNQTIDELLLIQEAKKSKIIVPKEEIEAELDNFRTSNALTESQLEDVLAQQNLTLQKLKDLIERKLIVRELLNQTILKNIQITEDQIQAYYDENKDTFAVPEKVKAAHILIGFNNRTNEEAYALIQDIESKVTNDNFCDLVKEYSEDPGSINTCGEYIFGKGEMVQEFEDAAFKLDTNEMEIVETVYGYHLIKNLESYPTEQIPLAGVSNDIKQTLHDEKAQENFDNYMNTLREKAVIVDNLKEASSEDVAAPIVSSNEMVNIDDITGENTTTETTKTTPVVSITSSNLDDFAKCLTDNEVRMYGAYWCPHCENNKKFFGDSFKYVDYVECAVEGQPQIQTAQCTDAGISGYPTWIVNGDKYPGEQTLEKLASLSGCKL